MFDFLREIAQSLRNNRLRTALTGIAVAWGIFMLIILLGAARGVVNAFESNFGESGANSIELYGGYTSKPFKGYKEGRRINLKGSDIDALEHDVKEVSSVMAFGYVDTAKVISTRDYVAGGLNAVFPEAAKNSRVTPTKGRFINNRDIDECRRVMVLHEKSAKTLFESPDEAVGKTVKAMGLGWTVVGIYDHKWRSDTYIPYTTLQSLSGFDDKAYKLTAFVDGLTTEEEGKDAEEAIRKSLGKKHEFAADDRGAVWSWNEFTNYLEQQSAFVYLNLAVWVIGIFTLLSGIVGVSNIMFVSVRERTHEIGIRRAIGAKPRSILMQILAESVTITTLSGYIGVVLGMAVLQVLDMALGDSNDFRNPTVDISIAAQVTTALIVAGALAGLFPAMKAIKVKPVEALRDE